MKKNKNLLLGLVIILMASCSGSDFYQGKWKATDLKGEKFDILYEANKFYINYLIAEVDLGQLSWIFLILDDGK